VDEILTKLSHIRFLGRFRSNRKGYAGIIASIFMVLIALFLFYNVFMFQINGNTTLQNTASKADQMLVAQATEQFSFGTPIYTFPGSTGNYVTITVNATDTSSQSSEVLSFWGTDSVVNSNPNWGENSTLSFVFQPGQTKQVSTTLNIPGIKSADPTCASLTSWLVTARGRTFSIVPQTSGGGGGGGSGGGGGNNAPFGLDQYNDAQDTVAGNTMTISITTSYAYDVLYLVWISGNSGQTINFVSTSGSSPNTSPWIERALISPDGNYWLSTWYAISTIAGQYSITITMNSNAVANCAAILFSVSGANTTAPFDGNARTQTGTPATGGTSGYAYVTTSNANDLIIGALGVQTNCVALVNWQTLIATQLVGTARFVSAEYSKVTTTQTNLQVGYAWNSNYKGNWGIVVDPIMKG
jgi:hypothetical protein